MKFRKVEAGEYEATKNGRIFTVRRSGANMDGEDWLLFIDGEFCNDYLTKRDAIKAANERI